MKQRWAWMFALAEQPQTLEELIKVFGVDLAIADEVRA